MSQVTPFIWFKSNAEDAMQYYVDLFGGSIIDVERYAGDQGIPGENELQGKVLTGTFEIMGQRFMCLDGGEVPGFGPSSAVSFLVEIDEQSELDTIWDKLLADGGTPQQCGWIVDHFGVTWQITPTVLGKLMSDEAATPEQKAAVMQAMMPMVKLDGPALQKAFDEAK